MKLSHFFLPHPETHKKAHLLSIPALLGYILIFLILQLSLNIVGRVNPGVLGINSSVTQQELIKLTNEERQKIGLPTLIENPKLNQAALEKGKNMFAENYWAHYSPTGKDPWGFIQGAGYKFSYAGENLARNFYNSSEVVSAWMASKTHKENILNSHYQEIGIAVLEGNLNGQPTILVIQEFGGPVEAIAKAPQSSNIPTPTEVSKPNLAINRNLTAGITQSNSSKVLVDPYQLNRSLAFGVLLLLGSLLILDLYIIRRRAITRLAAHHLPHLALISVAASTLINMTPGSIL